MKSLIYILLVSGFYAVIGDNAPTRKQMKKLIKQGQSDITSPSMNLTFSEEKEIFRNNLVIVWKGTYNGDTKVAIKISADENHFNREVKAYEQLQATGKLNVEKYRIPRVYYHGPILGTFGKYFAIVMTLFDEDLETRFKRQRKHFSESTILLIFKQATEALHYIHSKNVYHSDLHVKQIFFRGEDVFIGDFDQSILNKAKHSSKINEFLRLYRLMFDLADVKNEVSYKAEGVKKVFKNTIVQEAFLSILRVTDSLKGDDDNAIMGNYDTIIKVMEDALKKLGPVKFDWLKDGGENDKHRPFKCSFFNCFGSW